MKIVLSGVETNNKGAELMLYAILQEIERKYPNSKVYISPDAVRQGLDYIKTTLKLKYWPYATMVKKLHLRGIFYTLHLPQKWLDDSYAVKADYFIDASGFCFSDQCKLWGRSPMWWDNLLRRQYKNGAKIIFLPQAFGPAEFDITKKALIVLNKYSTIIMPREKVSYNYLKESGLVDMNKVIIYPDFTSLVEGVFPQKYNKLKNGICVIPNMRMIDKGIIAYEDYITFLSTIIEEGKKSGHPVYLLNHEGVGDEMLMLKCKEYINDDIDVVTGLNALEVKGLIASAYLVITSRFHGLASSLNSCVPSLATSWSHKYQELYKDYNMTDCILPLNANEAVNNVRCMLVEGNNNRIRQHLSDCKSRSVELTKKMWSEVWNF